MDRPIRRWSIHREVRCVNAVEIIQSERWQICRSSREHLISCGPDGLYGGVQLRVLGPGLLLNLLHRGQGRRQTEIVHGREVLVKVWEDEHRQLDVAAIHLELSFAQSAIGLVGLQLCLDYI